MTTRQLYRRLRKCERKWRRYGRAAKVAQHHGDTIRAADMETAMIHWLGHYNSAVMRLFPEDYE